MRKADGVRNLSTMAKSKVPKAAAAGVPNLGALNMNLNVNMNVPNLQLGLSNAARN